MLSEKSFDSLCQAERTCSPCLPGLLGLSALIHFDPIFELSRKIIFYLTHSGELNTFCTLTLMTLVWWGPGLHLLCSGCEASWILSLASGVKFCCDSCPSTEETQSVCAGLTVCFYEYACLHMKRHSYFYECLCTVVLFSLRPVNTLSYLCKYSLTVFLACLTAFSSKGVLQCQWKCSLGIWWEIV